MDALDLALRYVVIGQLVLLALVLLLRHRHAVGVSGAVTLLTVIAYVLLSGDVIERTHGLLFHGAVLLAMAVPLALWWFSCQLFEMDSLLRYVWPAAVPALAVFLLRLGEAAESVVHGFFLTSQVVALLLVLVLLGRVMGGRLDDLLQRRRDFRVLFVAVVGSFALVTLLFELGLQGTASDELELLSVFCIEIATLGLALPVLLRPELIAPPPLPADPLPADPLPDAAPTAPLKAGSPEPSLTASDEALAHALDAAMAAGAYARPGLTIATLAGELGVSEHRLRALINGRLGFRNFSTYLNGLRVEAAAARLTAPEDAHIPILTIALDVGFASIGPFNRAFKARYRKTPSAYRADAGRNNGGRLRFSKPARAGEPLSISSECWPNSKSATFCAQSARRGRGERRCWRLPLLR